MRTDRLKILVVEDDEDDQFMLVRIFTDFLPNAEIIQAFNGKECISNLEANSQSLPDLITLDLNMPFVNGIEAIAVLKNSDVFKKINLVVLSTSNSEKDIQSAMKCGADDYFIKPVEYETLKETIKQIIEKWL